MAASPPLQARKYRAYYKYRNRGICAAVIVLNVEEGLIEIEWRLFHPERHLKKEYPEMAAFHYYVRSSARYICMYVHMSLDLLQHSAQRSN